MTVSVVVPTYNRAYCIARTLDSVLAQTHRDLEIVLVDDGSSDDTEALVAARYGSEPRVRYLRRANGGAAAARNHGLREARGDTIALLDSDDLWQPWKLEAQLRCLAAVPGAGMVWTDMDAIGPDGELVARRFLTSMYSAYGWFSRDELFAEVRPFAELDRELAGEIGDPLLYSGDIFSAMVLGNLVHTSTVLLTRERLERVGGFNEELRHSGEDYDFHLRTCREGKVAYLDAASILYQRGRADQLTVVPENRIHMAQNFLRTIAPVIERDRDRIRLPRVMIDEVLAEAHAWVGECHVERGERREARRALAESLRHKPRQARVLGLLALSLLPAPLTGGLRRVYRRVKRGAP